MAEENKAIEKLKSYKELFSKGYCKDCNELCVIDNFPSKDLKNSIDIVLNLIETLQKENEELKRNSISKKRVEKFLEVIKPQAMPKDIPDDLEIDEEGLLSKMYNSGAVGALETILDRNNDIYKKGKQYGKEF